MSTEGVDCEVDRGWGLVVYEGKNDHNLENMFLITDCSVH